MKQQLVRSRKRHGTWSRRSGIVALCQPQPPTLQSRWLVRSLTQQATWDLKV